MDVVGAVDVKTEPSSAQMSLSSSEVDLQSCISKPHHLHDSVRDSLTQESESSSGVDGSDSRSAGRTPTPSDQGIVVNLDQASRKDISIVQIKEEPMV